MFIYVILKVIVVMMHLFTTEEYVDMFFTLRESNGITTTVV